MSSVARGSSAVMRAWSRHKGSLTISFGITLAALLVYLATFMGERPTPLFDFIARLELDTLDTRFRLRGRVRPDPRIIIVDIDQRSQEVLGRWPFSRIHFARMLDNLREDGARVVAFDITFSKPEEPLRPFMEQLAERKQRGLPVSPKLLEELARLDQMDNSDQQFAKSIQGFGKVVLGNYFLYTQSDLEGVSDATLDHYANLLAYFPYPLVRAVGSGGQRDYLQTIRNYEELHLAPKGAEANTQLLTMALSSDTAGTGFFNVVPDPDGAVRRAVLALPYGRSQDRTQWDMYASLDVQAIRLYRGLSNEQTVLDFGPTGITSLEFGSGSAIHPDSVSRMIINYQGGVRTYPYVSIADVVNKNFPSGSFRDKLVLVGASATGIGDLRTTPFGGLDFPGVEVHANIIDNLLNQNLLHRGAKQALTDVAFIVLFGIPLGIWLALVQPRWLAFGILFLVPFATLVYWAFLQDWWLNFVTPSLTLVVNVGLVALYRVLVEEKEKRRVRGAFQQYLSPAVIRLLLESPEQIDPRKRAISVMFTDIRGFTTLSENLDAQVLAHLLNDYLTEMTKIIFRHQGTLDKYIGDAVMAFWGAPLEDAAQDAARACDAGLEMIARLRELNRKWVSQGLPSLEIGVGINTGIASVGNMGSTLRYGYTALGDAVNLASRLEGLNKEYATRIIVSESTRLLALPSDAFLFRGLDYIRVKGKGQPVEIHELLCRRDVAGELVELAKCFDQGREAYKRRDWQEAARLFENLLERWPDDGPARIFRDRVLGYLAEAPASDWDGVYIMKHK